MVVQLSIDNERRTERVDSPLVCSQATKMVARCAADTDMCFERKIRRQHVAVALPMIAFAGSLVGGLWYPAASFKNGVKRAGPAGLLSHRADAARVKEQISGYLSGYGTLIEIKG